MSFERFENDRVAEVAHFLNQGLVVQVPMSDYDLLRDNAGKLADQTNSFTWSTALNRGVVKLELIQENDRH